ncbi:P-loop ATPase, Sll1717 family [Candidatus Latescibacterota bacterium]
MNIELKGLIGYSSELPDIGYTINQALKQLKLKTKTRGLISWEENDIPGRFIGTEVMQAIDEGTIFIADITRLNFNVVFEIGYAIGRRKRVILVCNKAISNDTDMIREVGIFDTLGYVSYSDSASLVSLISEISDITPLQFNDQDIISKTPVYLILPPTKSEVETYLISRIKKARLFYRSYDPEELGRLSAFDAIENVAASHGVIIPLLLRHYSHNESHNIRASFVAGLTMGMEKLMLLLQSGDDPVPLDYRDLVNSFKFPNQIDGFVGDFASDITARFQSGKQIITEKPATFLSSLTLGSSSAENEYRELGDYYLETDEFLSVLRGDVNVVLGRKGSGKTALFFQLRDRLRQDKHIVVLDLKPEGFQLLKFKEQVLDFLEEGTREHTITAFWEYLLLLEICHKLLQNDRAIYLKDHNLYDPYQRLSSMYNTDEYIAEGDFAERMLSLTKRINEEFIQHQTTKGKDKRLRRDEITELLYKHDVSALLNQLIEYLQYKQELWILVDNLDKGWPPHGIEHEDVLSLRCLLDAIAKMERSFQRKDIPTKGIIFIRNDVYENLVESMPDRGKISNVLVDWTDSDLLLELLRRRFLCSGIEGESSFEDIWPQICVSHIFGEDSAYYMIDRSLMRPRSLIEFVKYCRSHAVNLNHEKIEEEDILQGEETYSAQLVNDVSFEIGDIFPKASNALYEFIECQSEFDEASLSEKLSKISKDESDQEKTLHLLLWYGVIGFKKTDDDSIFIYSVRYDMRRLLKLLEVRKSEGIVYIINPAFWRGLEVQNAK